MEAGVFLMPSTGERNTVFRRVILAQVAGEDVMKNAVDSIESDNHDPVHAALEFLTAFVRVDHEAELVCAFARLIETLEENVRWERACTGARCTHRGVGTHGT